MKTYKGQTLHNVRVSYKIDGICGIFDGHKWASRAGKPLYNLPRVRKFHSDFKGGGVRYYILEPGRYEIFLGDWGESVSVVRTQRSNCPEIPVSCLYRLDELDERLEMFDSIIEELKEEYIKLYLEDALGQGYEGLVLTADEGEFKVKPVETYDVPVIGVIEGKGRNKGRLGAFVTSMGNVGTGLTDKDRKHYWGVTGIVKAGGGKYQPIIEVECMSLTAKGKFRHPRFIRVREDK